MDRGGSGAAARSAGKVASALGAIAKRGDLWRAGAMSQVLRPMLQGRHTGALVTVTTADGRLHVRPGKVRKHLRRCFEAVLNKEGNTQWFEESEEDKRVLRDDPAGWVLREKMVSEGACPSAHPRMKGLTEMVKTKEGAEEVAARLEGGLRPIDLGEWTRYWGSKGWGNRLDGRGWGQAS
jgi:hypothetical protein